MKVIVCVLFFVSSTAFGQTVPRTESAIEKYVKVIDRLNHENKLVRVSYHNMSDCGGSLDGYYLNKSLVLMKAVFSGELGFIAQNVYLQDQKMMKLIYREHFPEWEKYYAKYPAEKYELDSGKMTYTDTIYTISLANPPLFKKSASQKTISHKPNQKLMESIISCGQSMMLELQEVIAQIDSLKYVQEMPYGCENAVCGDQLYWKVIQLGDNGIELLIDKLDDSTPTTAKVVLFGGNFTVADIAYDALNEIIHNIPTFELLGVPFDKAGCGYCAYWNHVRKSDANRRAFKEAVRIWYHQTKNKLVWVESNKFATCECGGKHPNGGHYELDNR
ncbi:MAG: hypothetical protein ACK5RG_06795 [Cyclobacteriaceae bacterium]|jgi:hypothetical protein|nr:hypothetical protein [Flammeovirgaceae bacterium]